VRSSLKREGLVFALWQKSARRVRKLLETPGLEKPQRCKGAHLIVNTWFGAMFARGRKHDHLKTKELDFALWRNSLQRARLTLAHGEKGCSQIGQLLSLAG
jgi:hypothetical protein